MKSERQGLFCLFSIYLLWGSLFLGNRLAVESLPPMIVVMLRHGIGGIVLASVLLFYRRYIAPTSQEVRNALIVGGVVAGLASGALAAAGVNVPSAFVAMGFTTMPLFMLILNWVSFEKITPSRFDFVAMPLGLFGSGLVLFSGKTFSGHAIGPLEIGLMIVCPLTWAFGSLLGRRLAMPKDIFVSSTLQMLGGASLMLILSLLHGDWISLRADSLSLRSVLAVIYIALGGSFLGYTAFSVAIKNLDSRLVGTYAIVNPVVAVALGILFGEQVGQPVVILGMALSISAVVLTFIGARFRQPAQVASSKNSRP